MERVVNIRGLFWQILDHNIWKIFNEHLQYENCSIQHHNFDESDLPDTQEADNGCSCLT